MAMLASTRGPPKKPVCAATNRMAASVNSEIQTKTFPVIGRPGVGQGAEQNRIEGFTRNGFQTVKDILQTIKLQNR